MNIDLQSRRKSSTKSLKALLTFAAGTAAALLLAIMATHSVRGQTIGSTSSQTAILLNEGLMNALPQPTINLSTDPPGKFSKVTPSDFDPGKTHLVQAAWLSGLGCVTSGFIATPNASFTGVAGTAPYADPACPSGDSNDSGNEGLLLVKTGPTGNFAAATAELVNVNGLSPLTELGYDIRKGGGATASPLGSHCGAGAPRFDVVTTDEMVHFLGCQSPPPVVTSTSTDWIRLRWDEPQLMAAFPPITPTEVIRRIVIVFDEGTDTGPDFFGAAMLDNIDVNGTLVGRGPVTAN